MQKNARMNRKNKLTGKIFENVEIIDIGAEGKSIAKIDKRIVFIPFGAPGDVVNVRITKHRSSFLEGQIISFVKESGLRTTPFCEHFTLCGGCKWQHIQYCQQLKYKEKQITDNLQRIGKIDYQYKLYPIVPSPENQFYRNKLEFTFSHKRWLYDEEIKQNNTINNPEGLGFHIPRFYDKVLDINTCWLQPEPSNHIRLAIKEYALKNGLSFFDIKNKEGFLRNLIIRNNLAGDFMIVFVFAWNDKKQIENILDYIHDVFPQVKSLYYMINSKKNDSISDLEPVHYKGDYYLTENIDELAFTIGPKSFYQTNSYQAATLYRIVEDFAGLTGAENVYDLYTGIGTIANFLAKKAGKIIGVDYVEEAIIHARKNASLNNIENTIFIAGDMLTVFKNETLKKYGNADVVITDPPRAGMHPDVLSRLKIIKPEEIVYVSCNPSTQARDIEMLSDLYRLIAINPVDMFPHTQHVENVALLKSI